MDKANFIALFGTLLKNAEIKIADLTFFPSTETISVSFENGYQELISVYADSPFMIIKDVLKRLEYIEKHGFDC